MKSYTRKNFERQECNQLREQIRRGNNKHPPCRFMNTNAPRATASRSFRKSATNRSSAANVVPLQRSGRSRSRHYCITEESTSSTASPKMTRCAPARRRSNHSRKINFKFRAAPCRRERSTEEIVKTLSPVRRVCRPVALATAYRFSQNPLSPPRSTKHLPRRFPAKWLWLSSSNWHHHNGLRLICRLS